MNKTSSRKSSTTSPTTDDLVGMVQALKQDFEKQRTELEQKVARLEGELARTRHTSVSAISSQPVVTTSRRNMLKKLAAGAAGAAVIGATLGTTNTPTASAATGQGNLNFGGYGGGALDGQNEAYTTTLIKIRTNQVDNNFTSPKPLLKLQNTFNSSPGADPDNLAIGVFGDAAVSHGVYGRSASNSGVVGVVGTNNLGGNAIFDGNVGGVTGIGGIDAGANAYGIVGMSVKNSGVLGLTINSEGVKGASQRGIGGAFAGGFDASEPDRGAPIRLAMAKVADLPAASSTHNSGEIIFDRTGRLAVCVAGFTSATPGEKINSLDGNNPFERGIYNPSRAIWRRLPYFVLRQGAPAANGLGEFVGDGDYHPAGEQWVDTISGNLHICIRGGVDTAQNATFPQENPGFSFINQKAIFKQVGGDIPRVTFLDVPDRWVDSRVAVNADPKESQRGILTIPQDSQLYTVQITGVAGRDGTVIPSNAKAVMGIVTAVNTQSVNGRLKVGPGNVNILSVGTSNCNWLGGQLAASGPFFTKLDSAGRINIAVFGAPVPFKPSSGPGDRGGGILLEVGAYIV